MRNPRIVLHNDKKYVTLEEMQAKPKKDRATLQLLHVTDFSAKRMQVLEKNYWSGIIASGDRRIDARITDPVYHERLNAGHTPASECLLTASLSMPYVPSGWNETSSPPCWKLIAGVIELR